MNAEQIAILSNLAADLAAVRSDVLALKLDLALVHAHIDNISTRIPAALNAAGRLKVATVD